MSGIYTERGKARDIMVKLEGRLTFTFHILLSKRKKNMKRDEIKTNDLVKLLLSEKIQEILRTPAAYLM